MVMFLQHTPLGHVDSICAPHPIQREDSDKQVFLIRYDMRFLAHMRPWDESLLVSLCSPIRTMHGHGFEG